MLYRCVEGKPDSWCVYYTSICMLCQEQLDRDGETWEPTLCCIRGLGAQQRGWCNPVCTARKSDSTCGIFELSLKGGCVTGVPQQRGFHLTKLRGWAALKKCKLGSIETRFSLSLLSFSFLYVCVLLCAHMHMCAWRWIRCQSVVFLNWCPSFLLKQGLLLSLELTDWSAGSQDPLVPISPVLEFQAPASV